MIKLPKGEELSVTSRAVGAALVLTAIASLFVAVVGLPWGPTLRASWVAQLPVTGRYHLSGAIQGPEPVVEPVLCSYFDETLPVTCQSPGLEVVGLSDEALHRLMYEPVPLRTFVGDVENGQFIVDRVLEPKG